MKAKPGTSALTATIIACATLLSVGRSEQGGVLISVESAQARVGRPLTPVSVAGVARRQTRRAVYGTAAVGAAAAGAYGYYHYPSNGQGFVCQPGTYFRGEDGRQHLCQ
ncbi:hypothetical protein [Bradyrhizobium acaciae]|uniref:hypothetical protein n=1 Tax=Bradyrhizobium acaciae TaxID=2683706 RepID=UPI001E56CB8C|nr:hypothetical protein [Bradyrhizobium acaciae]